MVSLTTAGRTYAGPSPLGNKTVRGHSAALIQAQQNKNYLPACMTISIKAPFVDDAAFNHPFSQSPVKGPYLQVLLPLLLYPLSFLYLLLRVRVCKC